MGIFDKFKVGFKKSASALTSGIKEIIIKKEIDDKNLDKIEEFLIQSDVGVEAASEIREIISTKKIDPKKDLSAEINLILKEYIISLMRPLENNTFFEKNDKLKATLISGVNGVGKTTTIGKIGKILKNNGNKVMFAASDTFRAAAIEQLENWANKIDVQITKSSQGSDPASVAYKAVEEAIKNNFNQVLIDTAGRLQNKKNLMEEYKKIANVTKKIDWKKRKKEFLFRTKKLIKNNKNIYDCLIPVSGGKDSTWQVLVALENNLKPLCVTWKSPARNLTGQKNLNNLISF